VLLKNELSRKDVALLIVFALVLPLLESVRAGIYWERIPVWLDNLSYVEIANVIRFGGVTEEQHFWGFPATIALAESIFPVSGYVALVLISMASYLMASFLVYRLYGALVAVAFVILSPEWVRLSIMGGSEPLFLCLLLISWLAFRSDRALIAATFASLATTVRPLGAIAICGFAFALILRRDWRRLAVVVCVAVVIGVAYLTWLQVATGSLFHNVNLYSANVWPSGKPFSFPFVRLAKSAVLLAHSGPWSRLVQPALCIAFLMFGVFALLKHARTTLEQYPAELFFVIGYLVFMTCYNELTLADFFPRLAIPVYPFLLFSSRQWLPERRFVYWPLVFLSALIASSDLVGFKTVFGFALHG
jgi:Gpi18-like mannosyltransferase